MSYSCWKLRREQLKNREKKEDHFHRKEEWKCAYYFKYCWLDGMTKRVLQQAGAAGEPGGLRAVGAEAAQGGLSFKIQTSVPFAQTWGNTSQVLAEKFLG